ncbi:MAG: hypothetical protein GY719_11555 [bacterium]|nr:hypothetical protein [bacterium]
MRSSLKLLLGLILLVSPASWAEDEIDLEPRIPTSEVPIRLILTGTNSGGCGYPGAFHSLTIEDTTLRVESLVFLGPCGLAPPTPPYAYVVDVGILLAGEYTALHVGLVFGTEDEQLIATEDFFVDPGVAVEAAPDRPTSLDAVTLRLTGIGSCPAVGTPEVAGSEIRISWDPGMCLAPPAIYTLESEPFGPLPAGVYDVVVYDDSVLEPPRGTAQFRVYPDPITVRDGRFEIEVTWSDFGGADGRGQLVSPPSDDSALVWFFNPENWELMVKVLDACHLNDHFWVFAAASTNVEYTIVVRDTIDDREWTFTNPLGVASPAVNDTVAFACP